MHWKCLTESATYSQLLLEALDLRLECVNVLSMSLVGSIASVSQLRQAIESLFQPLHICQQLCDLKHTDSLITKHISS